MKRLHASAALLLMVMPMAVSAQVSWKAEAGAASKLGLACFGQKNDAECTKMIGHYEAALAAPDATAQVRHEVLKYLLNAIGVRGKNLIDTGKLAEALKVLDDGRSRMLEHFDGGKHWHTIVENLRLQAYHAAVLVEVSRHEDARRVVESARDVAEQVYQMREELAKQEHTAQWLNETLVRSEELETLYADALLKKGVPVAAGEAYKKALAWLQRASEAGLSPGFGDDNVVRYANLNNKLAASLLASGEGKGAAQAYMKASAVADCAKFEQMEDWDQLRVARVCNDAFSGYLKASGEGARIAREQAERLYKQQMELYRTDISDVIRMLDGAKK